MSEVIADVKTKTKLKEPSLYKVVFINDDFTPMDFVVAVLIQIFDKTPQEAEEITVLVHKNGKGVAGVYSFEVATQKKLETEHFARSFSHPLQLKLEKA